MIVNIEQTLVSLMYYKTYGLVQRLLNGDGKTKDVERLILGMIKSHGGYPHGFLL